MNIFDSIQVKTPKRNVFDLSHEVKMTANMGELVPFLVQEAIPGDTFICNSEMLLRVMPMISPVMHRVDCYTHFFFCPNRLIWNDWDKFISGQEDLTVPFLRINDTNKASFYKNRLGDYLGIPPTSDSMTVEGAYDFNVLPFLAYRKIYEEYYRDQNLVTEYDLEGALDTLISDPDNATVIDELTTIQKRAWEKDYFTSCLPTPQRGEDVLLPIGTTAPIVYTADGTTLIKDPTGARWPETAEFVMTAQSPSETWLVGETDATRMSVDNSSNLLADLENATAVSINEFRIANQLQKWAEKSMRAGNRIGEILLAFFGVNSDDHRLHRPEYLGGGKQPIVISEVLSTVGAQDAPQGTMTGHGASVGKSNQFKSYIKEHGYVIGILSVIPRSSYNQGVNRTFFRKEKEEFFWPEFAQLGEQEVLMKELYLDYEDTTPPTTPFGYQSRYADYKYQTSRICGEMRNSPFDGWHFGRIFSAEPALNQDFVECVPGERPFPVKDGSHKLIIQIFNYLKAVRPIPYFNEPTL